MDSTAEPHRGCLDDDGVARGERWNGDPAPEVVEAQPAPAPDPPPSPTGRTWPRRKRGR